MATTSPPFKVAPAAISRGSLAFLLVGPPGSGKTTILGTMPGRGIVINTLPAERGAHIVLANKRDRIDVVDVSVWDQIQPIVDHMKLPKERHGYDWVALDSFTGLNPLAKKRSLKERGDRGISADPALMTKQDWGNMGNFLFNLLFEFLSIQVPKLVIAQESTYESEGLESKIGPDTRPPVIGFLLQSMSGIGRLYSAAMGGGVYERRMLVAERSPYMTKWQVDSDRTEWPAVIKNPNLDVMLKYAYGPLGKYPAPEGVDEQTESQNTGMTEI